MAVYGRRACVGERPYCALSVVSGREALFACHIPSVSLRGNAVSRTRLSSAGLTEASLALRVNFASPWCSAAFPPVPAWLTGVTTYVTPRCLDQLRIFDFRQDGLEHRLLLGCVLFRRRARQRIFAFRKFKICS